MSRQLSPMPLEIRHPILVGVAAGLIAGVVTARADRVLNRLVSEKQKKLDRKVRKAPAHQMAGPHLASKILGRRLTASEKKRAGLVFSIAYGLGWGMIHSGLRKKFPGLSRWVGLPFAIPFFFACDGVIAPSLGVSPGLNRIPWQPSAKEMGNHIAWTAAAELVHRIVDRAGSGRAASH